MQDHAHALGSLSTILIIFTIAGVLVPIFQKLRISPILGYLICGLIIGPFGLTQLKDILPVVNHFTISDISTVSLLGEIGIIFLMFMIGLELSLKRLLDMKKLVLGLGTAQILVTTLIIATIVLLFGNSIQTSIIIGFSFALSSTAIVMQLLEEQHQSNRSVGLVAFSILLMQDLAVVPLLVILGGLSNTGGGEPILFVLLKSLLIAVTVVTTIYIVGTKLLKPILSYLSLAKNPEWLVSLVFLLAIGGAVLTQSLGLSAALGAFLAGLLVAETDFRHEVEVIIEPVKSLLLGIFFLSVGMQVDVLTIIEHPFWIPASVLGLFLIKTICLYPLARQFKIPKTTSMETSVRLAQAGEFALLMLGLAIASGIIPKHDGQFFLLVASLSIFMTPLLTKLSPVFIRKLHLNTNYLMESQDITSSSDVRAKDLPIVLIAGYGRVGRLLGGLLEEQRIPFIAVEHNFEKVKLLKEQGHRVIFADARKIAIWRKLHVDSVKSIVIAIDSPDAAEMILKSLRTEWPNIPIIVRTHDTGHMDKLYSMGATHAIPEALEASMVIAAKTLSVIGLEAEKVELEIDHKRQTAILKHEDINPPNI